MTPPAGITLDRVLAEANAEVARVLIVRAGPRLWDDPRVEHAHADTDGAGQPRRSGADTVVKCTSGDGSLTIVCEPLPDAPEAAVTTASGVFRGPDMLLTISESWSSGEQA